MVRTLIKNIKSYAKDNNVPIVEDDSLKFLLTYIEENNIKTILEIGTAIGYSSINMANINNQIAITTIERNESMHKKAIENIKEAKMENQIEIIFKDALEVELAKKYDLIFIDAAKGQYKNFFEKYENNLEKYGTIITDNVNFHGMVDNTSIIKNRNTRQLVRKIKEYREFLKENSQYKTEFINIGDGLSISKKE